MSRVLCENCRYAAYKGEPVFADCSECGGQSMASERARKVAEKIVTYITSSDDAEPEDSTGSPTEYIASIIATAIATERAEILRGVIEMLQGLRSKEMVIKDLEAAIRKSGETKIS